MEDEKNSYLPHPKCSLARSGCHNGVTKRVQQLMGGFLALSFAVAGLVAISPTLHVAIEIPSIPIRTLVGFLVRLSRSDTHPAKNTSDPLPASPNHDHHSLAQSLACGCIEGSVGVFILEFDSPRFSLLLPSPAELSLERRLDTQSAGRAPPAALS